MATLLPVFIIILLTGVVVLLGVYFFSLVFTRAPFIPLSRTHLPDILEALELGPSSVFYELGCGDGRIVLAAAQSEPQARCIGIEYALAPWLLARLALSRAGLTNASVRKENFFTTDISDATHVFCYLLPPVMKDLHAHFTKVLAPGTKVVCCDFDMPNKSPERVLDCKQQKMLGEQLYVYRY